LIEGCIIGILGKSVVGNKYGAILFVGGAGIEGGGGGGSGGRIGITGGGGGA